jgi:hypothetical protein
MQGHKRAVQMPSTSPTSTNTTKNHQLTQGTPPWTIAAAAINICCRDSPKPLITNNVCKEKGQCKLFPNQFTTFTNSNQQFRAAYQSKLRRHNVHSKTIHY